MDRTTTEYGATLDMIRSLRAEAHALRDKARARGYDDKATAWRLKARTLDERADTLARSTR